MENVVKMFYKGHIPIQTDNDLTHFDPRERHQVWILSRVLNHGMDLKQNTDGDIRLLMIASALPVVNTNHECTNCSISFTRPTQ